MDEMYKDLETPEGERKFSRIAKARDETAKISRRSHPQSTVQSGWKNRKRVSGVLCDRKMKVKIEEKVYIAVVCLRPALMYGAETLALKKAHKEKLEVA